MLSYKVPQEIMEQLLGVDRRNISLSLVVCPWTRCTVPRMRNQIAPSLWHRRCTTVGASVISKLPYNMGTVLYSSATAGN